MRSLVVALFGPLLFAGLVGCQGKVPDVVKIGVAQPLSGPLASLGTDMKNGAQMAVDELNAQPFKIDGKVVKFELVAVDDAANPEQGKRVAQQLVDAQIHAVVGHLNSGVSMAAAPIYAARGIPQMAISTNPKYTQMGFDTTFRMVANDNVQSKAMGSFAVNQLRGERIALVDDGTVYGTGLAALAAAEVDKAGKKITVRQSLDDKTTEFASLVTAIGQARTDVLLTTLADFQVAALMDQLAKQNLRDVIIIGGDTIKTDKLLASSNTSGGIYATSPVIDPAAFNGGKRFIQEFSAKFKSEPIYGAHYSYDAVHGLAHAIRRISSVEPKALVAELKRKDLNGPATGGMNFGPDGEQRYPTVAVYRVERGRWEQMIRSDRW